MQNPNIEETGRQTETSELSSETTETLTLDEAEIILERMYDIQNQIKALDRKEKMVLATIDKERKRLRNEYNFIEMKNSDALWKLTVLSLRNSRYKSLPLTYGTLQIRTIPEKLELSNPELAETTIRELYPEFIKPERLEERIDYHAYKDYINQHHPDKLQQFGVNKIPSRENFQINLTTKESERDGSGVHGE